MTFPRKNFQKVTLLCVQLADDRGVGVHMHVAELKEEIDFCAKMHQGRHTAEHLKQ